MRVIADCPVANRACDDLDVQMVVWYICLMNNNPLHIHAETCSKHITKHTN